MLHGGSNFGNWSDDSTAASYDYAAAIGQTGDLRPIYYQMKRANQLAPSFPGILGNSDDALPAYRVFRQRQECLRQWRASKRCRHARTSCQNNSSTDATATFKSGETLRMPRYSNYPLPQNAAIADGIKIVESTAPVLGIAHNDHLVTVIVYGLPGERGRLTLSASGGVTAGTTSPAFVTDLTKPDR